jgi:hypothetical protein
VARNPPPVEADGRGAFLPFEPCRNESGARRLQVAVAQLGNGQRMARLVALGGGVAAIPGFRKRPARLGARFVRRERPDFGEE